MAFEPVAAVRAEPSAAVARRLELVRPVRVERSASGSAPAAGPVPGRPWTKPVPSIADGDAAAAVPGAGAPVVPVDVPVGVPPEPPAGAPQTLQ